MKRLEVHDPNKLALRLIAVGWLVWIFAILGWLVGTTP